MRRLAHLRSNSILFLLLSLLVLASCDNRTASFQLPSQTQSFGQVVTYNNKVDILFVIDNSKSMTQHQQRLAARVPDMIQTLNRLGMNYHVAVTSTTMTTNTSSYPMTRQLLGEPKYLTAGNIHLLNSRLLVGESGSDLERGLDAMAFIAKGEYVRKYAPGFLRNDALFVTIFLGDEEDQSSEFGSSSSNDFINFMNQVKPPFVEGGKAWMVNFIGALKNSNCDNLGGHVSVGFNYLRLVDYSGGVKESICSNDLSAAVANIKARIVDQLTSFRLKSEPLKETIRIAVGGREVFEDAINGWTLEIILINGAKTYWIKFHGNSIPGANEGVRIDFKPAHAG